MRFADPEIGQDKRAMGSGETVPKETLNHMQSPDFGLRGQAYSFFSDFRQAPSQE